MEPGPAGLKVQTDPLLENESTLRRQGIVLEFNKKLGQNIHSYPPYYLFNGKLHCRVLPIFSEMPNDKSV